MTKEEAKELIGKPVTCWTAFNGTYAGIVTEIITQKGKPWRGVVQIKQCISYPSHGFSDWGGGWKRRKPIECDTLKEFGGTSIEPIEPYEFMNYKDSVLLALKNKINICYEGVKRPRNGILGSCLKTLVIDYQELTGEEWRTPDGMTAEEYLNSLKGA